MTQSILRIEDFLAQLHKITLYGDKSDYNAKQLKQNKEAINKLCKKEVDFLRRHVEMTTLRRYRTDYRNAIKLFFKGKEMALSHTPKNEDKPGHIALKYFILKRNEVANYADSEKTRKEDYLCGNVILIDKHNKLVAIGTDLLESTSFYEVAIGLLLMTGRRTVEILKTGSFEVVSKNKVRFFGQAKTKKLEAKDGYEIYTLCDSKKVCDALSKLRSLKDFSDKTNRQVESSTSGRLGITLRKHLVDDFFFLSNDDTINNLRTFGGIEVKSLRDIWLKIARFKFKPLADNHYFATQMLGHASGSTASNYMEFELLDSIK